MFNHSATPNVAFSRLYPTRHNPTQRPTIVFRTFRAVQEGEELFICYSADESKLWFNKSEEEEEEMPAADSVATTTSTTPVAGPSTGLGTTSTSTATGAAAAAAGGTSTTTGATIEPAEPEIDPLPMHPSSDDEQHDLHLQREKRKKEKKAMKDAKTKEKVERAAMHSQANAKGQEHGKSDKEGQKRKPEIDDMSISPDAQLQSRPPLDSGTGTEAEIGRHPTTTDTYEELLAKLALIDPITISDSDVERHQKALDDEVTEAEEKGEKQGPWKAVRRIRGPAEEEED